MPLTPCTEEYREKLGKPKNSGPLPRGWLFAILAAAGFALAVKLALALNTFGSTDSLIWEAHLKKIQTDGVLAWYRDGVAMFGPDHTVAWVQANHPPAMAYVLGVWNALSHASGLPLRFWIRLTSSLADVGSILLLLKMCSGLKGPLRASALLFVALSPVSIMVSGFHVNTDPIMVFFLLLSIFLIESGRPSWAAGAAFGLAMSVKLVPVLFAPAFLLYLPDMRRRAQFVLSTGAIFLVGAMPYWWQAPALVVNRTFGYTPQGEYWGVAQMIQLFLPDAAHRIYSKAGKLVVFVIVLLLSFQMNRRNRKTGLFLQCGCIASQFLFWSPGFGYQYLTWLAPWSGNLVRKAGRFYYVASAAFLFAVYTVWSRGLPWYFANTLNRHVPLSSVVLLFLLGTTCWVSVGAIAYRLWRESVAPHGPPE